MREWTKPLHRVSQCVDDALSARSENIQRRGEEEEHCGPCLPLRRHISCRLPHTGQSLQRLQDSPVRRLGDQHGQADGPISLDTTSNCLEDYPGGSARLTPSFCHWSASRLCQEQSERI